MSVNQAGLEHNFSDLKIKKTCLRNRLKLPRLEKMAKVWISKTHCSHNLICYQVGADIRTSQMEARYINEHRKRKNHNDTSVAELLIVPHYANLLDEDAQSGDEAEVLSKHKSGLVKSCDGWQREMAK
jgi:hypothetical protein